MAIVKASNMCLQFFFDLQKEKLKVIEEILTSFVEYIFSGIEHLLVF